MKADVKLIKAEPGGGRERGGVLSFESRPLLPLLLTFDS
jgi:hypothetical protein